MRARSASVLVPMVVACYSQAPLSHPEPAPGVMLSVELTDNGTVRLGPALGSGVVRVEGELVEWGEDDVVLAVRAVERMSGVQDTWSNETVAVPRRYITRVQQRLLSTPRTAAAAGLFAAGLLGLYAVMDEFNSGGTSGGTPPVAR